MSHLEEILLTGALSMLSQEPQSNLPTSLLWKKRLVSGSATPLLELTVYSAGNCCSDCCLRSFYLFCFLPESHHWHCSVPPLLPVIGFWVFSDFHSLPWKGKAKQRYNIVYCLLELLVLNALSPLGWKLSCLLSIWMPFWSSTTVSPALFSLQNQFLEMPISIGLIYATLKAGIEELVLFQGRSIDSWRGDVVRIGKSNIFPVLQTGWCSLSLKDAS